MGKLPQQHMQTQLSKMGNEQQNNNRGSMVLGAMNWTATERINALNRAYRGGIFSGGGGFILPPEFSPFGIIDDFRSNVREKLEDEEDVNSYEDIIKAGVNTK